MTPGTIAHVEHEIWQTEQRVFDLHDDLVEVLEATAVVIRFNPPDADRMLSLLRKERSLIRQQQAIYLEGLDSLDALLLTLLAREETL